MTEAGIPERNPNPLGTIPNILQEAQVNLNRQVAVNFPDVLGDTLMLPMILMISPISYGWMNGGTINKIGSESNFLQWANGCLISIKDRQELFQMLIMNKYYLQLTTYS